MPFELLLKYATPLTPLSDPDEVLREFLRLVGYLPEGDDARIVDGPVEKGAAYRLLRECLLKEPERAWYVEEVMAHLGASRSTVYRHINKLKSLDLLEEVSEVNGEKGRKAYRLRYGNVARAWDFAEAHAQNALRRYRDSVNHLQMLLDQERNRLTSMATPAAARPRGSAR